MSHKTIYRCDLCGNETTDTRDWELDANVVTFWGSRFRLDDTTRRISHGSHVDICPRCLVLLVSEFNDAWVRITEGAGS